MQNDFLMYLIHFIIGGTLITLIYHFSKLKNTVTCAIILAFPSIFIIGFFMLYYFGGNLENYVHNAIYIFGLDVLCMILLLIIIVFTKNALLSFFIFIGIYIYILYFLIKQKYLL